MRARQKGHSPGMCGICRRDMRIGEDGEGSGRRSSESPSPRRLRQTVDDHRTRPSAAH